MPEKYDPNTLWVALSEYGEGNLFHIYPKLLAELLRQEDAARQEGDTSEAEKLILPSDKEWRLQQYFYLVALQKNFEVQLDEDGVKANRLIEDAPEVWAPWNLVVSVKNPNAPPPVDIKTTPGPAWDIGKVLKAANLLCKPPIKVDFIDEQEMRCVYSLIYDVFRYKTILEQAINDIDFFVDYSQFKHHRPAVWLFLMELARRSWGARSRGEAERAVTLLEAAGSPHKDIENTVWEQRVHFAAAIARIRIKNKAFSLSELLPPHLREERISACVNKETVTGWVNTFKAKFITLRPPENVSIGQLDLVRDGVIVLQEREFCEGASTLCRALRANSLRGVVAQTHASSPRCTAYLAAQLRELAAVLKANMPPAPATPELGKLVIFGAGDKAQSYVCALKELGIEASAAPHSDASVCVLSEPVHCDTPTVVSALDGVVAALATPPNSYSAVTDPIDLVCGRGGDLAMLEILTECEMDVNGKARVQSILEEQKKTLKVLLSKPQIQLILYETHSALDAENKAQVMRAVAEANRLARERHALLKKKPRDHQTHKTVAETIITESSSSFENTVSRSDIGEKHDQIDDFSEAAPSRPNSASTNKTRPKNMDSVLKKHTDGKDNSSRPGTNKARPIPEIEAPDSELLPRDPDKDNADVYVPNCDLFEVRTLPNLGNGLDINYILDRDGCYLGLIQRKEITRLDAKYMIQVAEERGLFGAGAMSAAPPAGRKRRKDAAAPHRRRRRPGGFEVERVAAPTFASLTRSFRRGSAPACLGVDHPQHPSQQVCLRHARRYAAATAFTAAACTCDARHRRHMKQERRASTDVTTPRPPSPPCRRPFPLVVHDLRLKTVVLSQNKIFAST